LNVGGACSLFQWPAISMACVQNAWRRPQAKIARELVLRTTVEAFPGILLVSYAWRQVGIPRDLSRSLVSVG